MLRWPRWNVSLIQEGIFFKKKKSNLFIRIHNGGMSDCWKAARVGEVETWRCGVGFPTVGSWCSTAYRCGTLRSVKHKDIPL